MSQETEAETTPETAIAFVSKAQVDHLKSLLEEASDYLPEVYGRKMFGCHTLFAGEHIYGLVWPDEGGRIGLKIPNQSEYDELMAMPGATAWSPGGGKMGWWVLLPPEMPEEKEKFIEWVEKAHGYALAAPPKPKRNRARIRK